MGVGTSVARVLGTPQPRPARGARRQPPHPRRVPLLPATLKSPGPPTEPRSSPRRPEPQRAPTPLAVSPLPAAPASPADPSLCVAVFPSLAPGGGEIYLQTQTSGLPGRRLSAGLWGGGREGAVPRARQIRLPLPHGGPNGIGVRFYFI